MPQVVFDELHCRLRVRHLDDQSPVLLVLELDDDRVGAVVHVPEESAQWPAQSHYPRRESAHRCGRARHWTLRLRALRERAT